MIWLAAQIWIFLLAAFALGGALGWFLGVRQRPTAAAQSASATSPPVSDNIAMREPPLHTTPPRKEFDDLTQIIGLDDETAKRLNALGVFYLSQIANWNDANVRWVEYRIDDPDRIARERWPEQAASLQEPETA